MNYCYNLRKYIGFQVLLATFISLSSFFSSAQVTATMTSNFTNACAGVDPIITFTGSNGTPPYIFFYNNNGGTTESISSGSGNTATITGQGNTPGTITYTLIEVTDANATTATPQTLAISISPLPPINAGPDITICDGEVVILNGTGGTTYTWNNNITMGVPFTPHTTAAYTVTGTNQNGCTNVDQVTVTVIPFSPPTVTASVDSATCNDGSLSITIDGGSLPYSVEWQTGSTSAMMTSLAPGNYAGIVYDGNGCKLDITYTVPASLLPSDCGTIKGSVHYDGNEDCVIDPTDAPIPNRMIIANPGNYITFTDLDGNYELHLHPGTYVVEEVLANTSFGILCTESYSVTVTDGQTVINNNFLDTISGGLDLQSSSAITTLTFGNFFHFTPETKDLTGAIGLNNVSAWFTIPEGITMSTWNYPHTISNDTVYYTINTADAIFAPQIILSTTVLEMGDTISICSGASSSLPESNLTNNIYCQSGIIVGPYDPNEITMFLNGIPSDSTILKTDVTLDYVIRFQNTGTAEAVNVYVLDTLSSALDLSSIQLISTSHSCQLSLLDNRVLKFNFPLIHLPDSNSNEAGSHGYIRYRVRQNPTNTVGTIIQNTAYIYFDFNEAVITNTTHDWIVSDLGTSKLDFTGTIDIFPNPTDSKVNLKSSSAILSFKLYGLNGQIIYQELPKTNDFVIDLSLLDRGIYLLNIETEQGIIVKKIQKM